MFLKKAKFRIWNLAVIYKMLCQKTIGRGKEVLKGQQRQFNYSQFPFVEASTTINPTTLLPYDGNPANICALINMWNMLPKVVKGQ